jgi:signal transduction histidine kinase
VKVATNGLMSAREELAATIQGLYRIRCVFRSDGPVLIDDHAAAIHLYRIAQEAVNNAVKHGKPTQIEIGLDTVGEKLILTIQDDGVGLHESSDRRDGMGRHTMNYRANMIGASLQLHRRANGGTVVTCSVPKNLVMYPSKEGA